MRSGTTLINPMLDEGPAKILNVIRYNRSIPRAGGFDLAILFFLIDSDRLPCLPYVLAF